MERRLGRGLGALLSPTDDSSNSAPSELEIAKIRTNPFQPRKVFDPEGLEELKASILNHGVLQPVVVRSIQVQEGATYELISGERRWRASKAAGRKTIPAVVRPEVSDGEMLELALVENVQRRDLDPIERGRGYRQLMDALQLTQEEMAQRVGLKRSTVANHLRLLELSDNIQEAVGRGWLSMGHARALLGLENEEAREEMMATIIRDDLSVRDAEKRVRAAAHALDKGAEITPAKPAARQVSVEPWVRDLENRLRESLGTKVRLQNGPKVRGQVVIEYYDQAGLEALIGRLAPKKTI